MATRRSDGRLSAETPAAMSMGLKKGTQLEPDGYTLSAVAACLQSGAGFQPDAVEPVWERLARQKNKWSL